MIFQVRDDGGQHQDGSSGGDDSAWILAVIQKLSQWDFLMDQIWDEETREKSRMTQKLLDQIPGFCCLDSLCCILDLLAMY